MWQQLILLVEVLLLFPALWLSFHVWKMNVNWRYSNYSPIGVFLNYIKFYISYRRIFYASPSFVSRVPQRIFKVISRRLRTNSISLELWKAHVVSYSFCSVKHPPWRCWLELFVTQYWTLLMSLHFISVDSWWLNETLQFHRTRFTHASAQLYFHMNWTAHVYRVVSSERVNSAPMKMNYLWWVNLPDISLDITEWKCDYAFINWHSKRDQHYPQKKWSH